MVHTRSQLVDRHNPLENVDPPTNSQNPLLNHNPIDVLQQREICISHTPSVGIRTHFSLFGENYGNELSPANAVKELLKVKQENQVLMELYREQVAANGVKA